MNFDLEHHDRRHLECVRIGAYEVRQGDRVRLRPSRRADIMDIALQGKIAIIEAIETDYDNRCHLAVVVDDDPGAELGLQRQIAHRFFFALDEVEPLGAGEEPMEIPDEG